MRRRRTRRLGSPTPRGSSGDDVDTHEDSTRVSPHYARPRQVPSPIHRAPARALEMAEVTPKTRSGDRIWVAPKLLSSGRIWVAAIGTIGVAQRQEARRKKSRPIPGRLHPSCLRHRGSPARYPLRRPGDCRITPARHLACPTRYQTNISTLKYFII